MHRYWMKQSTVAFLLVGLSLCMAKELLATESLPAQGRPALTVQSTKLQEESWVERVVAVGSVTAWQEAVVAAEIGGLPIKEIFVDVGSQVTKGQPLAQMEPESVLADVAQQQARVAEATAVLDEAKANAQRARSVKTGAAMSDQEIKQYLIAQDKAQASLDANRALLKSQEIRLRQTRIVAIDEGVVSVRTALLGSVPMTGAELFRLVRQNRVEWRAEITAKQAGKIKIGQLARLRLNSDEVVEGKVRSLGSSYDENKRTLLAYVDLPIRADLRPGLFAQGEIQLAKTKAMTLPQSAIIARDGFRLVFEIGKDLHVIVRKVETGRQIKDRVEVVSGIDSSASLVLSGGEFLNDGDQVRVQGMANR